MSAKLQHSARLCASNASVPADLFLLSRKLARSQSYLHIHEKFLKAEITYLKNEIGWVNKELTRMKSVPLLIGQFQEMIDEDHAIVQGIGGMNFYVRVLTTIDREKLKPMATIAMHRQSQSIIEVLPEDFDITVSKYSMTEKPNVTFADIGGLEVQKQEIREAVELPLICPELYEQTGVEPPTGVLLYGPPGTGKTLMAKAVANSTNATFFAIVGSEFVHKYLGEGPRLVREIFRMAKEHAPSIIFIDEADTIATKRYDAQTGADREVQRILMELLNQMDGFDQATQVKVIMATNRVDTLDPALLRPGRLDRKIEFPIPDKLQRRLIFQACMNKMNVSPNFDLHALLSRPGHLSAADIAAICQEAGMRAIRADRYVVEQDDFEQAWNSQSSAKNQTQSFYSF